MALAMLDGSPLERVAESLMLIADSFDPDISSEATDCLSPGQLRHSLVLQERLRLPVAVDPSCTELQT